MVPTKDYGERLALKVRVTEPDGGGTADGVALEAGAVYTVWGSAFIRRFVTEHRVKEGDTLAVMFDGVDLKSDAKRYRFHHVPAAPTADPAF